MAQKKAVIGTASVLLVLLVLVGFLSLAADVGSKEDPLVGMSYIAALEPQIKAKIDEIYADKAAQFNTDFDKSLSEARNEISALISAVNPGTAELSDAVIDDIVDKVMERIGAMPSSSGDSVSVPASYKRVDITKGKTVTLAIGTTFFLRSGNASVYAEKAPGLIDLTSGNTLDSGAIKPNVLYCATFDYQKGFKTSGDVIVFIQGEYKIT